MLNPRVTIVDCDVGRYMVWSGNDALGKILLSEGAHELSVLQVSEFILKNSAHKSILDIGANIGTYSIPLALAFPEKRVYSFEIQKAVFYQLCGNVFLNRVSNVDVLNIGISGTEGVLDIPKIDYSKCWNVGGYSINDAALRVHRTDFPNQTIVGTEPAQVTTLDTLQSAIADIALIKLDIEGHEIEALKGGHGLLEANGFPPIIFECWEFEWFREQKDALFAYLREMGYSMISSNIGYFNYVAQSPKTQHKQFSIENNSIRVL